MWILVPRACAPYDESFIIGTELFQWKLRKKLKQSLKEPHAHAQQHRYTDTIFPVNIVPRMATTTMTVTLRVLLFYLGCIALVNAEDTPSSTPPYDHYPNLGLFGKFQKPIARGATGDVVLFQHNKTMKRYAVKAFVRNHIPEYDEEYDRDIREEFNIARRLAQHGNIVETYDLIFDPPSHRWYMPMQYCPDLLSGRIRAAFSTEKSKDQETAVDSYPGDSQSHSDQSSLMSCIFGQLLKGLSHMHDRGITHGDLKPNNIGIDERGQVRVLDFGISFQTLDMLTGEKRLQWGLRGAIPYAPPEVYLETLYDPVPVDIFALAILFCEMTEPRLPWKRRVWPDWERDSFSLFRHDAKMKKDKKRQQERSTTTTTNNNNDGEVGQRAVSSRDEDLNEDDPNVTAGGHHRTFPFLAFEDWETEIHRATMDSLVTLLPVPSRWIIRRMLEPDPNMRATWTDIWSDEWVQSLHETC
ncbi:uncharacterized protein PV06_07627 [Exophiala oligosperma]|uniref:Protein kinase domain-containing protein n=1 Tax=Exophiala oligosperma TaxID=215243 RepID=A0A0D2DDB6_9EURO|nr:uncharacterized protein PV06_07627 [Exophiala oligosperma]KIW40425.1 hypothetical protein PV06_07627 [Exophiala oligosperma]